MTVCTPGGRGQRTVPGIVGIGKEITDGAEGCEVMFGISVTVIARVVIRGPVGTPDTAVAGIGGMF